MIETITTADGTKFAGFPKDHLFSEIKRGNVFVDDFLLEVIAKHVKADSVCLDVGANLGYVSLYLAKRCKKVIAFEPQPIVYLQLCTNLFLNEQWNVTPLNLAAHSYACALDFADYQSGWVGEHAWTDYGRITSIGSISLTQRATGKMKAVRLDDAVHEKVDFIKIDTQGADIDAVLGCEDLVRNYRPVIAFEYEDDLSRHNYSRTLADLENFETNHNYSRRKLYGDNYLLEPR